MSYLTFLIARSISAGFELFGTTTNGYDGTPVFGVFVGTLLLVSLFKLFR